MEKFAAISKTIQKRNGVLQFLQHPIVLRRPKIGIVKIINKHVKITIKPVLIETSCIKM